VSKEEFKARWESGEDGGGITYDDLADCYARWGLGENPRTKSLSAIRRAVLKAAEVTE
jgi:hypothetical protein